MLGLATLFLAATPDAGAPSPEPTSGIVRYGSQQAGESWGPAAGGSLTSVLDVSSVELQLNGPLSQQQVRETLTKEQYRFDKCARGFERYFVVDLKVNFRGVVTDGKVWTSPVDPT